MVESEDEEGQVKEHADSNGSATKEARNAAECSARSGAEGILAAKQRKPQGRPVASRSASPEPKAWNGGNGRADRGGGSYSPPLVIAGTSG